MKIEQIRILPLVLDPPAGGWPSGQLPARNDYTLVEVLTDEGVCGLGLYIGQTRRGLAGSLRAAVARRNRHRTGARL
jgi:hypothetical protein